jgi:hypothetical protein
LVMRRYKVYSESPSIIRNIQNASKHFFHHLLFCLTPLHTHQYIRQIQIYWLPLPLTLLLVYRCRRKFGFHS